MKVFLTVAVALAVGCNGNPHGRSPFLNLKVNHEYHWVEYLLTVDLSSYRQAPSFSITGNVIVTLGNCKYHHYDIFPGLYSYEGSCSNKITFSNKTLTNGGRLVYQSGQITDPENGSSSIFVYDSGHNLPTSVTIILSYEMDGSYGEVSNEGIYVENAYIVASYYKQDYSKDFTPVLVEQVIQKYEYPESKGNPFLTRANGLVLELVQPDITTVAPSPTTVAPITTTVAPSTDGTLSTTDGALS